MDEQPQGFHFGPALDFGASIAAFSLTLAVWDSNTLAGVGALAVGFYFLVETLLDIAAAAFGRR